MNEKTPVNRVNASAAVAGGSGTVVIAWLWNTFLPSYPMPAEVAAGMAPMVGYILAWIVGWLGSPLTTNTKPMQGPKPGPE